MAMDRNILKYLARILIWVERPWYRRRTILLCRLAANIQFVP